MATAATTRPRRSVKRGSYAKSSETREKIFRAALAVAGKQGLHAASVAAIAQKAGVAIGNLHYHFGSRDELLDELMQWQVGQLLEAVRAAVDAGDDFFAKDEAAFRAYLAYVHRNPACIRLAEEVRMHRPKLYAETNAMWLAMFGDEIRNGVERGELRSMQEDEIGTLAYVMMGARYFVDQMMQTDDYPGDDVAVAAYTSLTRRGLEKRP